MFIMIFVYAVGLLACGSKSLQESRFFHIPQELKLGSVQVRFGSFQYSGSVQVRFSSGQVQFRFGSVRVHARFSSGFVRFSSIS